MRGVTRFADKRRERRLSDDEYAALATALKSAAEAEIWPPAVGATRFLLLTGWRLGEVLGLRRQDVDLGKRTALLSETKTGRSVRPLSAEACDVIRGMAFEGELADAVGGVSDDWSGVIGEDPGEERQVAGHVAHRAGEVADRLLTLRQAVEVAHPASLCGVRRALSNLRSAAGDASFPI